MGWGWDRVGVGLVLGGVEEDGVGWGGTGRGKVWWGETRWDQGQGRVGVGVGSGCGRRGASTIRRLLPTRRLEEMNGRVFPLSPTRGGSSHSSLQVESRYTPPQHLHLARSTAQRQPSSPSHSTSPDVELTANYSARYRQRRLARICETATEG